MLVNRERQWVFFCEPHTASRACQVGIPKCIPGTEVVGKHHDGPDALPPEFQDFTFVATVRNPFETLITKRWGASTRKRDCSEYLERMWHHHHLHPCYRICFECHRIIWYEHLIADLNEVLGPGIKLDHDSRHSSPDKPKWYEHIPRQWREKYYFRDDVLEYIHAFGYEIDIESGTVNINPEVRAAYVYPA